MSEPITTAVAITKAVGAAKAGGSAADAMEPAVAQFAAQVSGAGRKEVGAWLADHVRLRRVKSQLKILAKAQKYAEEAGYEPSVVKLNVLVPLLEGGSLEDDEDMVNRWAGLLANSARGGNGVDVPPSFPGVLRELSPTDAKILDLVFDVATQHPREVWQNTGAVGDKIQERLGLDASRFGLSADNLYRLRLCAPPAVSITDLSDPDSKYQLSGSGLVCLTDFGHVFVTACRPPAPTTAPPTTATESAVPPPVATSMNPHQQVVFPRVKLDDIDTGDLFVGM